MHGTLSIYLPNRFSIDALEMISVHIGKIEAYGSPIVIPSIIIVSHGTPYLASLTLRVGGSGGRGLQ